MRGKLRDKRAMGKQDNLKRELVERRKLNKRETRTMLWNDQETENDEYDLDVLEEEEEKEESKVPRKK